MNAFLGVSIACSNSFQPGLLTSLKTMVYNEAATLNINFVQVGCGVGYT